MSVWRSFKKFSVSADVLVSVTKLKGRLKSSLGIFSPPDTRRRTHALQISSVTVDCFVCSSIRPKEEIWVTPDLRNRGQLLFLHLFHIFRNLFLMTWNSTLRYLQNAMKLRIFKYLDIFVGFSSLFSNTNKTDKAVRTCSFRNAEIWNQRWSKMFQESWDKILLHFHYVKRPSLNAVLTLSTVLGSKHLLLQQCWVIV